MMSMTGARPETNFEEREMIMSEGMTAEEIGIMKGCLIGMIHGAAGVAEKAVQDEEIHMAETMKDLADAIALQDEI